MDIFDIENFDITKEQIFRLDKGGRIILLKDYYDALGLGPQSPIAVRIENGELIIRPLPR